MRPIDLDRLRQIQSRERDAKDLRALDDDFYDAVASYVGDLAARRGEQEELTDERQRIEDELATAKRVTEAIHERRVGKIVRMASLAASGVEVDDERMTEEEREMFAELVAAIETNHEHVVGKVEEPFQTSLAAEASDPPDETADGTGTGMSGATSGETADGSETDTTGETPGEDRPAAEAASAAGDPPSPSAGATSATAAEPDGSSGDGDADEPGPSGGDAGGDAGEHTGDPPVDGTDGQGDADHGPDGPPDGFVRVRVVDDVPAFVGTDGVEYDPDADDLVTIPEENADALCGRDAAERVEDAGP